jgi:membrane peptidoglycan carboxypeptidase
LVLLLLLLVIIQFCAAWFYAPAFVSAAERSTAMPLNPRQFPAQRLQWLLKIDDPNFFQHHGVDFSPSAGGYTTITQSLVKTLFFDHFEPGFMRWKKIRQSVIALAFDRRVPKDEQLRLFVNTVYLGTRNGREIRGFADGAQQYFGKDLRALSDQEYLSLVAVISAPAKYAPDKHVAANRERVQRIERLLAGACKRNGIGDADLAACAIQR